MSSNFLVTSLSSNRLDRMLGSAVQGVVGSEKVDASMLLTHGKARALTPSITYAKLNNSLCSHRAICKGER